jgi:hypothetical protein
MRRCVAALLVVSLLIPLMASQAQAAAGIKVRTWSASNSNLIAQYNFSYTTPDFGCGYNVVAKLGVSLGTVTSTQAYIKSVSWTYILGVGSASLVGGVSTVSDNYNHEYPKADATLFATTRIFTHTINHWLTFNQNDPIIIEKQDKESDGGPLCGITSTLFVTHV